MPHLLVVGGPNGAGKTTLAEEYVREYPGYTYLGADAIAAEVRPDAPDVVAMQAARLFLEQLDEYVDARRDLVLESTLAGRTLVRHLQHIRRAGYSITVSFVFVEHVGTCLHRVAARVQVGGHDVPEEAIVRRYHRSIANFWTKYRYLANRWHLWYNGDDGYVHVASGSGNAMEVFDSDRFSLFSSQAHG